MGHHKLNGNFGSPEIFPSEKNARMEALRGHSGWNRSGTHRFVDIHKCGTVDQKSKANLMANCQKEASQSAQQY